LTAEEIAQAQEASRDGLMDRLVLGCGGAVAGCPRGRGWPRGRWPISVSRVGRLTITPSRSPACMFVRHRAIGGGGRRPTDTSHTSKTRCNLRAHARQIFLVWSPQIRDIPGSGHTPIQIFQGLVEYPLVLVPVSRSCPCVPALRHRPRRPSLPQRLHMQRGEIIKCPPLGIPREPTPPVPGALSASRAEPRIGEGRPLVPHFDWYDDLSTPYACARQRCVSDPSHIHP
jgi:hypothetical protein